MTASYDLVVVGAGPGGIAAAVTAAERGLHVALLDDNHLPGGQIWRGLHAASAASHPHGEAFLRWTSRLRGTRCTLLAGWRVVTAPAPQCLRIERDDEFRDIGYGRLILATGARERFLPFPGWTLPGIMGVGGMQALVKAGLDVRGRTIVVAGTGPLLLAIAAGLARSGARIAAICEQAPLARLLAFGLSLANFPGKIAEAARYRSSVAQVPFRTGCWVRHAEGAGHVQRVTLTDGRKQWTVDCDWLACGFHLVPNLELPRLLGCALNEGCVSVDALRQSSVPGVACIGEITGIGGMEKAILEGEIAGLAAAGHDAEARARAPRLVRFERFARNL
ncbi:MAG: FAD-dependent oxidoreductase, partial [Terracidiphilus sp.]